MADSEIEEEDSRFYLVKHKASDSKAQIKCKLDKNMNARLQSVQLLSGKVISLSGVREALKKIKKDYGMPPQEPDRLA